MFKKELPLETLPPSLNTFSSDYNKKNLLSDLNQGEPVTPVYDGEMPKNKSRILLDLDLSEHDNRSVDDGRYRVEADELNEEIDISKEDKPTPKDERVYYRKTFFPNQD